MFVAQERERILQLIVVQRGVLRQVGGQADSRARAVGVKPAQPQIRNLDGWNALRNSRIDGVVAGLVSPEGSTKFVECTWSETRCEVNTGGSRSRGNHTAE